MLALLDAGMSARPPTQAGQSRLIEGSAVRPAEDDPRRSFITIAKMIANSRESVRNKIGTNDFVAQPAIAADFMRNWGGAAANSTEGLPD
jgi:hypothetical protein